MLDDNDYRKWRYRPHTAAKHAVLEQYMKAWLPILGHDARRQGERAAVVIIDGFAGRGQYERGEPGSPLILRELAREVLTRKLVDEVELFYIERNQANHSNLTAILQATAPTAGIVENPPIHAEFAGAAPVIVDQLRKRPRPSFWFIDPFGFSGLPLIVIRDILRLRRAEVFVTFMTRDVNRFLTDANHQAAIGELLELSSPELEVAVRQILSADRREQSLRELYERRLKDVGGAKFVWAFRVAVDSAGDTIYYLVHASTHIKAFREMKDATHRQSAYGTFAFLGRDDFAAKAQLPLFAVDDERLRLELTTLFSGREVTFDDLCDEVYPHPRFFPFVEKDFRRALNEMAAAGSIQKIPVTSKTSRGLQGRDRLRFPHTRS